MASNDRLSDEEVHRRAEEARRQRDRERQNRGVMAAIDQSHAKQNMGRGHDPILDTVLSGLIQGAGLQWGDEIFGGMRDFEGDQARNPALYDASSVVGMLGSPLAYFVTRGPLRGRERLFNEAKDALAAEGVAQRELSQPGRVGLPMADRRFAQPLPYTPAQADINALTARGRTAEAQRLGLERSQALDQTEEMLALRRGALDEYSGLDAAGHGLIIGSGGVDPGATDPVERASGGVLGALGALGLTRGASELKDLSGYPIRGARWSAQHVVDLPGKASSAPDVEEFLRRARMLDEAAFRERTNDTFFGRAAGPSATMRIDPNVAPIDDSNALIRTAIAKAQQTPAGQAAARSLDDEITLGRARENFGGLSTPQPLPQQPTLPAWQKALPEAMRTDPLTRPDALRTTLGDERYFPSARGEGVDPALRSNRQVDDLKRGRVDQNRPKRPPQYPGMGQEQRRELAHMIVDDAYASVQRMARLPRDKQVGEARRLLSYLDDPHTRRLMTALQLRQGKNSPEVLKLIETQDALARIAKHGTDYEAATAGLARGNGRGPEPVAAEAASMLSQYPMSRRMAEAILDPATLAAPREAYWVNPAERGDHPLLQVRRESVRPPWPYRAPASVGTQYAGDALALLLDHAQHGAWEGMRAQ